MNELSERLRKAIAFLKRSGYIKTQASIARRMGIGDSFVSEAINGVKAPGWGFLLDFCDAFPINFWWLRTGEGDMVKDERERRLLKRIEELEEELRQLRE